MAQRDSKGRLLPGHSQPGPGRPKSLAAKIKEKTNDLEEEIDIMIELAHGKYGVKGRDRIEAIKWLADRSYGRALEISAHADITSAVNGLLEGLPTSQLLEVTENLKRLTSVAQTPALPAEPETVDAELVSIDPEPAT